jgi:hypothetical protein
MSTIPFDTLAFAAELIESGLPEKHANAIAKAVSKAQVSSIEQVKHDYELDNIATKRDLKEMELALRKDIEVLRADSRRDIAESKAELIRWVMGVGLLQTTILAGLMFRLADKI